jgi:hypothetical protein
LLGAVAVLDHDLDGIDDVLDACPGEAEDHDGYQDADGCPESLEEGNAEPAFAPPLQERQPPHGGRVLDEGF